MSPRPSVVCLITPGLVATTPRLRKEADALQEAGYRVHIVQGGYSCGLGAVNQQIAAEEKWAGTSVPYSGTLGSFGAKVRRNLARRRISPGETPPLSTAIPAQHAHSRRLASAAAATGADLFIGHCLAGLAAAGLAARTTGKPLGFDAEDFHDEETHEAMAEPGLIAAGQAIQREFLPRCVHLTASSPLIAQRFAERYGVSPQVVLNVFPRHEAPPAPTMRPESEPTRPVRFYWFSQTIGPGRGLEDVIAAAALMKTPVEFNLRGSVHAAYDRTLRDLAAAKGLRNPIVFYPPANPREMARLAVGFDLGLSTEKRTPPNHDLCLSNKIFTYLLAGLPQLLSNTAAQSALAPSLGDSAILADLCDPAGNAKRLDDFFSDPQLVLRARREAWQRAQDRYCWDIEKDSFLQSVRAALERRTR